MNRGHDLESDAGNTAIEVLLVALVGGALTVACAFQAFSVQKASFAAQQLARQVVRLEVLGGADDQTVAQLTGATAANLHLTSDQVGVKYSVSGSVGTAVATVLGQSQTAKMKLGD